MDLSLKSAKVKEEYIEENTDFLIKDVPEPLSVLPLLPQRSAMMEFSPLIHHPQLFQPFPPPFYHQMPSFNLAAMPPPALRDFLDPNLDNHKRKSSLKIHESNNKKIRDRDRADVSSVQPLPPNQEKETKPSDESSSGRSRISCPVCGDTAVAHFHYGGMCCYSCKAFFRRVVNTYKVTKYTCRSGTGQCDVSLANRRSCQACRYKKCIAAGMKPGLVLSDDQCNKRFGMKKEEENEATNTKKPKEAVQKEDINYGVVENEYAVLIDAEKSFDEQVKIGKSLFVSLLTTGTVTKANEEEKDEVKELTEAHSSISETLAMMISFQTERQLSNARKFLPIKLESGKNNTGHILNTLIQQIVLLLKKNKHFKGLSVEDQAELCEVNVLVSIVLSILSLYSAKDNSFSWPGSPPCTISIPSILAAVDNDIKDEMARLAKFFDAFSKMDLPRSSVNLLIFVSIFNPEFCSLEDKEAVVEARQQYINILYKSLCHSVGVRRACTLASKLHLLLQNLDRICQILGQKFVSV